MKKMFLVGVVLLVALLSFVSADTCDDFCQDTDYSYGECRETTEERFCLDGEEVFGFDQCSNAKRCCCGEGSNPDDAEAKSAPADESVEETEDQEVVKTVPDKSVAENMFWFLLVIVIILALAHYMMPKQKKIIEDVEEL
jgi:hypothetical protein